MSEKSILNLLSSVAILPGQRQHSKDTRRVTHTLVLFNLFFSACVSECKHCVAVTCVSVLNSSAAVVSHSAVVVDAVDLSTDEDPDPAVAPLTPVGQQVGDQQSQTCR